MRVPAEHATGLRLACEVMSETVAIRTPDQRVRVFVSSTLTQADLAGAAGHLKEGLDLAAGAGDETSAAYYLEVLAAVAGQQGNPQRAARLPAAARSILETSGSGWLHAYVPRAAHDDAALAALRSAQATPHSRRPGHGASPQGADKR
jgi:hypothetical protein